MAALKQSWANTQAAAYDPLPPGIYRCLVAEGRLFNSQSNGTPGYKLILQVLDGPHAGRRLWHDIWLTPDAMARAKYELGEFGITDLDQLEQPLPVGLIVEVVVTLRTGDDGLHYNKIRSLKAIPPAAPVNDFARRRRPTPRRTEPRADDIDPGSASASWETSQGRGTLIDYWRATTAYCHADPGAQPEIPAYHLVRLRRRFPAPSRGHRLDPRFPRVGRASRQSNGISIRRMTWRRPCTTPAASSPS